MRTCTVNSYCVSKFKFESVPRISCENLKIHLPVKLNVDPSGLYKMDDLISRLEVLVNTVKILDGQRHVRTSMEEYSKIVESLSECKSLLREHQNELGIAQRYTEKFQNKRQCLEYLNKKSMAIKNYIRDVPKPSSVPSDAHSSIAISESSRDIFGSAHHNAVVNDMNQPYQPLANSTIDNGRPQTNIPAQNNLPATPKPRANLDISVSYITNGEFAQIPQYMKGRLKYDELNVFIDLFNEVLNKKYSLLAKPRAQIKAQSQMEMVQKWNSQKTADTEGLYFIEAEDFVVLKNHKFSKRDYSIIIIMRHLKKIKEIKNKTSKFYAILV